MVGKTKDMHCLSLFYPILFYSILFYSVLFYSILLYLVPFYLILFYLVLSHYPKFVNFIMKLNKWFIELLKKKKVMFDNDTHPLSKYQMNAFKLYYDLLQENAISLAK